MNTWTTYQIDKEIMNYKSRVQKLEDQISSLTLVEKQIEEIILNLNECNKKTNQLPKELDEWKGNSFKGFEEDIYNKIQDSYLSYLRNVKNALEEIRVKKSVNDENIYINNTEIRKLKQKKLSVPNVQNVW